MGGSREKISIETLVPKTLEKKCKIIYNKSAKYTETEILGKKRKNLVPLL